MSVGWGPGPIATDIFINILQRYSYEPVVRSHSPNEVSLCQSDYAFVIVQSTISMHSILMLRETRCSEIESEGILESIYLAI